MPTTSRYEAPTQDAANKAANILISTFGNFAVAERHARLRVLAYSPEPSLVDTITGCAMGRAYEAYAAHMRQRG